MIRWFLLIDILVPLGLMFRNLHTLYNAVEDSSLQTTGQWTHVFITWEPDWGLDLIIDGKLIAFDSYGVNHNLRTSDKGDLVLGATWSANVMYATCGSAVIDNLMVWHTRFIESEALAIYSEEHNLLMASSQNLTPGIPFKVLVEDENRTTCASLESQSGSSQRSMIVELKWLFGGSEAGMSNVRIEFSGSYNIDYLKVYTSGEPKENECSRLSPCEIDPYATSSSAHWSNIYYCDCPTNDCARFFLSTTNGCDVSWTYCEPIKICSASFI